MATPNGDIWDGAYKIPWDDPDFSRRMLAEHLAQDHDLASRRFEWIERQAAWIHGNLLDGNPADVLDVCCGPGFYSHRLTSLGHRCRGIDFGPASIEYAEHNNPDPMRCTFLLGDVRQVDFDGPYDLAMVLFGELNVFSPADVLGILRKTRTSLAERGGSLILEIQTAEAIEREGRGESSEQQFESGLFSPRPHTCRTECQWFADVQVAVQTFTISEALTGQTRVYHSTTKAWADDNLVTLLETAGFRDPTRRSDWPCNTPDLALWTVRARN